MQVAILTLSWLLFHFTRDWIKYLTWPCFRRKDSTTSERLQAALKNSKPSKALVEWEGLAEFQDTQVWSVNMPTLLRSGIHLADAKTG